MAKLALTANPTFKATVKIPVPGAKAAPVEFKFNGMTKEKFKSWLETLSDKEDVDAIMEISSGWDIEDPFNAENVARLVDNYIGAAKMIFETYIGELSAAKLGN